MSWAHILSFSRAVAGPVVAALTLQGAYLAAGIVFSVASLTDLVDGKLARYSQRVSPLGVFLDTTSDKVLVSLTLIGLVATRIVPAWIVLVIVGREFLISGLRSYAASQNRIISAHMWGKGKATVTMVAAGLVLFAVDGRGGGPLSHVGSHALWSAAVTGSVWLLGLAAVLTVISGARYLVDAWPLLRNGDEQSEPPVAARGRSG